jgi:hypothetical protein
VTILAGTEAELIDNEANELRDEVLVLERPEQRAGPLGPCLGYETGRVRVIGEQQVTPFEVVPLTYIVAGPELLDEGVLKEEGAQFARGPPMLEPVD